MIGVFSAFLLTPDVEVTMFAVELTVAVFVGASVVRTVFVPSSTALMGDATWWLPGWLDRLLLHVDVEGVAVLAPPDDGDDQVIGISDAVSEFDDDRELVHA